jgi:hypothetical protein
MGVARRGHRCRVAPSDYLRAPPQIRTRPFRASGSSDLRFCDPLLSATVAFTRLLMTLSSSRVSQWQFPKPTPPLATHRLPRVGFPAFMCGLAQQRYVKSHRILANCRSVKDFRRFRNSQDGTWFSRRILGAYSTRTSPSIPHQMITYLTSWSLSCTDPTDLRPRKQKEPRGLPTPVTRIGR